jgi:hypothetical protein
MDDDLTTIAKDSRRIGKDVRAAISALDYKLAGLVEDHARRPRNGSLTFHRPPHQDAQARRPRCALAPAFGRAVRRTSPGIRYFFPSISWAANGSDTAIRRIEP